MRIAKPLLVSGLIAAAVVAGLAWYVSYSMYGPGGGASEFPDRTLPPQGPERQDDARFMPPAEASEIYSDARQRFFFYHPEDAEVIVDAARMAEEGHGPVCNPEEAVVCVPYGKERYAGTNFGDAGFSVRILPDRDAASCLAARPLEQPAGVTDVNDTRFRVYEISEGAMSHRLEGRNYRVFRSLTCFELATRIYTSVFEVHDPSVVREFTETDRAAVETALDAMFRRFWFRGYVELL